MKPDYNKYPGSLVPAIIQDAATNKVLMLGFMNPEAFDKTNLEGKVTFYSRSKDRLWTKGETSGNFLLVKEVLLDCDEDTILIKAQPVGQVCHKGYDTCFKENNPSFSLLMLEAIITDRKNNPTGTSYTSSLFAEGINKIVRKVGEEAVELVIEAKDEDAQLFKNEAADLLFHYLVLLQAKGFLLADIENVLEARFKK